MSANNKANVSTTRGVQGGYAYSAPVGTEGAPTKANFSGWGASVPTGWENLGYISSEGVTEGVSKESGDAIQDLNLDNVDETDGTVTETISFTLMENKKHSLGTAFGHNNVSDENGVLEAKHKWGDASEHYQYVFLLLLKNGRKFVKYVPDAKVGELGEVVLNRTTANQRQITLNLNADESGVTVYDWYESTETTSS